MFAGDGAAPAGPQAPPGAGAVAEGGQAGTAGPDSARGADGPAAGAEGTAEGAGEETLQRTLVLRNELGLHARPAAQLARKMSELDARVQVNGVDAASVLALMGLGLTGGAEIQVEASGPQAAEAIAVLEADVEAGFGEELAGTGSQPRAHVSDVTPPDRTLH